MSKRIQSDKFIEGTAEADKQRHLFLDRLEALCRELNFDVYVYCNVFMEVLALSLIESDTNLETFTYSFRTKYNSIKKQLTEE